MRTAMFEPGTAFAWALLLCVAAYLGLLIVGVLVNRAEKKSQDRKMKRHVEVTYR